MTIAWLLIADFVLIALNVFLVYITAKAIAKMLPVDSDKE